MKQGCLLPDSGSLSVEQRARVLALLHDYMREHDLKQGQVARQLGMSAETFNPIYNGKYDKPKLDEYLRDINQWVEMDSRRRATRPVAQYVETVVAQRLMGAANKAHESGGMWAAYGPTGIGKTLMAHVIVERFPGAIYVRVSRGNTGYIPFRRIVAERLGMFASRRRRSDMSGRSFDERIFDALRDTSRLLVIDEAHRLRDGALEFLRDLNDETSIPMLLLCTKDLRERLLADADHDHGQLYSRFNFLDVVAGRDKVPGGKTPLFTDKQIHKMFSSEQVRLATDAIDVLHEMSNRLGRGSLRLCRRIMDIAVTAARARDGLAPDEVVTIDGAWVEKVETDYCGDRELLTQTQEQRRLVRAATA